MSELPDTDVWRGEQGGKRQTEQSKYVGMLTSRIQKPSATSWPFVFALKFDHSRPKSFSIFIPVLIFVDKGHFTQHYDI